MASKSKSTKKNKRDSKKAENREIAAQIKKI